MLSERQEIFRKQLLAKIHMHSECMKLKQMDFWEDWLFIRYEVISCKDLSIDELEKVLYELRYGGEEIKHKPDFKGRMLLRDDAITSSQVTYMKELWAKKSNNKDEMSLAMFSKNIIGKHYLYVELMNKQEATKVITVLEKKL